MPRIEEIYGGYKISDLDTSGSTQYFGFVNKKGEWYILELTSTAARYCKGDSTYSTNWTNRATLLVYDTYDSVF